MDHDQQQQRDDRQSDDQNQRGNSAENEQERFGDQVRSSPQSKKGKDRVDPQSNLPTDRPLGEVRNDDQPTWTGEWNDQRLTPSSADTDLDSDIERGV